MAFALEPSSRVRLQRVFLCGSCVLLGPRLPQLLSLARPETKKLAKIYTIVLALQAAVRYLGQQRCRDRWSWLLEPPAPVTSLACAIQAACFITGRLRQKAASAASSHRFRFVAHVLTILCTPSLVLDALERPGEADACALLSMAIATTLGGASNLAASLVILLMLTGGEALEHYAFKRATVSLDTLLGQLCAAKTVLRVSRGTLDGHPGASELQSIGTEAIRCDEGVPVESVGVGDTVLVKNGEVVPVDGVVVATEMPTAAEACIDESLLTGEAGPVIKRVGDAVHSGSSVVSGALCLKVLRTEESGALAAMRREIEAALDSRRQSKMELRCASLASFFAPFALVLAAAAYWLAAQRRKSARDCWRAVLAVLMAATPCPLSIGVPVAFLSGLSLAARQSITLKTGSALESMARVNAIVLDKTGTLTHGNLRVVEFQVCVSDHVSSHSTCKLDDWTCLACVASLERASGATHGAAIALWDHYMESVRNCSKSLDVHVDNVENSYGKGVAGRVLILLDGESSTQRLPGRMAVGSHAWILEQNLAWALDGAPPEIQSCGVAESLSVIYFAIEVYNSEPCNESNTAFRAGGLVKLRDSLRSESKSFIESLTQRFGLEVYLFSGDSQRVLDSVSTELGIPCSRSKCCLPNEKSSRIRDLQAAGYCVAMVGDGANDTAALAAADVGISIGVNDLASSTSDVVVGGGADPLGKILSLLAISRQTVRIAQTGAACGMSASLLQMAFAALGALPPPVSAALQECVDVSAVLNSMRALLPPSRTTV